MERDAFVSGARDAVPMLLGIVPFGLVTGVASADAGLTLAQSLGLSAFVFAGASQLAALSLVEQGSAFLAVVATAVAVNLRMGVYSASIAPYFEEYAARWRALLAFLLIDEAYAISLATYRERDVDPRWYYVGVAGALWVVWQLAIATGVLVGADVPPSWGLDFAVPLVFLALLVPTIEGVPHAAAAVVAAAIAVYGAGWPFNAGLLVGALAGILTGFVVAGWRR
ncbi:4-azaleucine resistance transporter AzlC [Halarchaeum rubridurum]|uniref:4-azaleucine resistance transporter AzlC n=1 Tax=Halarchaeum rubridurum TaxID=489911 RepID=A0A830FT20_9EURY|nr:AzlC family ABC transporter permease [Halarchaeum rubridurum]MBP1954046.1 4-azaleucine resistance transporter AzlC [Halarchaeum rubridurum]GGM56902.1 branched-chain amino acid ABC transporter permease [Halarchaeum rubridurum]